MTARHDPDHPATQPATPDITPFEQRWSGLEPEFRRCLELAWESAAAGSLGIGSVITDRDGIIVASGRNRSFESERGEDHLAGSPVAHAEINALGKLRSGRGHLSLTLWSSLEPCLLCAGGIRLSRIGAVRFLAADPLWKDLGDVPDLDRFIDGGWPSADGHRHDEFAAFAMLLPYHAVSIWRPDGDTAQAWQAHVPEIGRLAAELVETNELVALAAASAPVEEVIAELWDRLDARVDELGSDEPGSDEQGGA